MSNASEIPDYASLSAALAAAGIESSASEMHGILCGVVSRGGVASDWSAILAAAGDVLDTVPDSLRQVFSRLMAATAGALGEGEMRFGLLLPDEEAGIRSRAEGISAWCQGYVMGLALGGASGLEGLSTEAQEAVADLIHVSGAVADEEGDVEVQNRALSEIEEFVRVAVQLIYEEYRRDGGGSTTPNDGTD